MRLVRAVPPPSPNAAQENGDRLRAPRGEAILARGAWACEDRNRHAKYETCSSTGVSPPCVVCDVQCGGRAMVEEVLVAAKHGPEDETEVVEGNIRLPDGEAITRRFLKGKLLGKGGFAKCYLATCLDSDEAYALKVVSKASLQKSSARQRQLKTEVRVHRMLNHKHVVRFEHSFETDHYVYILLELCPNKSMVELLKRRTRLEECEVRYYLVQLVAAVRHMHARGIIHRDLKLGNIFLDQDMQCKVGDLGLAAKCGKSERKQTMCGTPNYIAPEILDATGHSFQVDLWSLGVVAYTLLVGRPPYECKDIRSTYKRILANSYCFPPSVPLSEHARHFVRSLLQTKPENRPTLDQVESLPFLARAKPHLPPSLPLSALHSPPPSDWLVIPRSSKPKSSSSSPISPPGPLTTTRRPLGLRDSNTVASARQPIKIHADPPGKKAASKASVDSTGSVRSVRSRTQPLAQQENIPPPSTKPSTAAPRILKSIPSAASTVASHRSPPLPRPRPSPPTPLSSTTTRPRPISSSPATTNSATTSASLRSRGSPSPASTPTIRTDTLPKRRTPVLSPPQDERPAFKVSPSTRSRGESTSPPAKPTTRSPALKPVTRKPLAPSAVSDKPDDRVRRRAASESSKGKETPTTAEPPVLRRRPAVAEEQRPAGVEDRAEQKERGHRDREPRERAGTRERTELKERTEHRDRAEHREKTEHRERVESKERAEHRERAESKERVLACHTRNPPTSRALPEVTDPLELIHRRLTRFLNEAEEQRANRPSSRPTRPLKSLPPSLEHMVPKVWIERYCDFSTKYGIGFLLNNGCAGVHFNDSTKIVVDAQGRHATYTERYTRQRTPDKGPSPRTHHVTRFEIDDYPEDLHKKVTLLQHFRKFLLQGGGIKGSSVPSAAADKETADPLEGVDDVSGPVYVRKWARTSLALVFRLSSRVLQIMFEHGEEVLITEDARVLTHVDALGVRTSYSLNAMLEAPSSGVVKRLQFANRLIEELRRT